MGSSILTTNTDPSYKGRVFDLNLDFPTMASTLSILMAGVLLDYVGWRGFLSLLVVTAISKIPALFIAEARKPT